MEVRIIEVNGKVYTEFKISKSMWNCSIALWLKVSEDAHFVKGNSRYRYYRVLGDLLNGNKEDKNNAR